MQTDVREALAEAVRLYENYGLLANGPGCGKWVNAARAALAAPQEQAEPVAWRYRYSKKARWNYADGPANDPAIEEEPLYASPKPAATPAQEPVARVVKDGATVRLEWAGVQAAHNAKPGPLYAAPVTACLHGVPHRWPCDECDAAISPQPAAWMVYFKRHGSNTEDCLPVVGDPYKQVDRQLVTRVVPLSFSKPAAEREGWVSVPVEPTPGLLMSMALRYDHGFGVPGYYDQPMMVAANHGLTHARRLEATIRKMRQLHEEVVGAGFYSPEREADYAALFSAAPKQSAEGGEA